MESDRKGYDYDEPRDEGTGSHEQLSHCRVVVYPFDKYEIKVRLTADNRFIEIAEVKVNKEFLSHKQKITPQGFHDVDEFYRE
jgi:hypothetical protein